MRPPGSFKLLGRHRRCITSAAPEDPLEMVTGREMRIVESLRNQIVEGGCAQELRIRRIFEGAREIYRIEIEVPELGYQRTTLLDGDALEELLAHDDVRDVVDHHIR
jgi:hypothetical protein